MKQPRMRRTAFTLVELLVVVAVIALLIALVLPSLQRARLRARDTMCTSVMRQALTAVFLYNGDYRTGLQNFYPDCQWWGQELEKWKPEGPGATNTHFGSWTMGDGSTLSHSYNEARGLANWWRGYLQQAGLATPATLGCPATDYRRQTRRSHDGDVATFRASYDNTNATGANHVETNPAADSFKKNPSFVWWGPPSMFLEVKVWTHSNLNRWQNDAWAPTDWYYSVPYRVRGPLLSCPKVYFFEYHGEIYHRWEPTHRPRAQADEKLHALYLSPSPYAQNVGYNDGSVRFFENMAAINMGYAGNFDPMK